MSPSNKKKSKPKPTKHAVITSSSPPLSTPPTVTDYTTSFATFISVADLSDIKRFCEAAGSSQEGINLKVFWGRAFAEGRKVGQEEEYNRGFNAGYNEGYSEACEKDYEAGLSANASVSTTEIGTQTAERENTTSHDEIGTQTDSTMSPTTSRPRTFVENGVGTCLAPTATVSVQTCPHNTSSPFPTPVLIQNEHPECPKVENATRFGADTPPSTLGHEMSSKTVGFDQNHLETAIFSKSRPKSPVQNCFSWADDASALPTSPTLPHPPRDLSGLRSSTANPFSSLKRRHRYPQNSYRRHSQPRQKRFYSHSNYYPSTTHPTCHSQPPFGVSLNWDQDPRLTDLNNALRALGWVRQ